MCDKTFIFPGRAHTITFTDGELWVLSLAMDSMEYIDHGSLAWKQVSELEKRCIREKLKGVRAPRTENPLEMYIDDHIVSPD